MKISKEARKLSRHLFDASFSNGRLDRAKIASVLDSVISQKPRQHMEVLKDYQRLVRLEVERRHAVIESAVTLSADVAQRVENDLRQKFGQDATLEFKVNPELIGGMRIKVGSDVWDGSVKARLARLEEQFQA